jgi:maleylpyruvate isomerase
MRERAAGALRVESDREGLLAWLVHGDAEAVEATGELPELSGL